MPEGGIMAVRLTGKLSKPDDAYLQWKYDERIIFPKKKAEPFDPAFKIHKIC